MLICAASPFESASQVEILNFIEHKDADLILLPGNSNNTPQPERIKKVIKSGVSVFIEQGKKIISIPYLVTSRELISMPRQIFTHNPTAEQIDNLVNVLPKRTFRIGSRFISFFICGEIIAFNPDGSVKHGRKLKYDILANPSHTLMGHWNHLGKKLSTLSKSSMSIYATNNNRNHDGVTTDVRIYKGGELLDNRVVDGKIVYCESEI